MQAHPLSSTAARLLSLSTAIATLTPSPTELSRQPRPIAPALVARIPETSRPSVPAERALPLSDGIGLAHDAGNLLGALGLYCDLLQARGVLRPEHQHYATELRQLSERSGAMIRRLLRECSQPNSAESQRSWGAPQPAVAACTDPASALDEQTPLLRGIAAPWATVSVKLERRLPALSFPVEVLERVTVNLVLNAAQAIRDARFDGGRSLPSPEGGEAGAIHVSLGMIKGRLRLTVEDDGPGLPPSIAAAFLRPAPMPPGAARGLGHRIVHELAETSGGSLSIRVRPGKGTAFCLDWPVANQPSSPGDGARVPTFGEAGSRAC
jgi:signal transduction histidine kinase